MPHLQPIQWHNQSARIIDQTKLPSELIYEDIDSVEDMFTAIRQLKVRGAPLIGISAAFGLYLAVRSFPESGSRADFVHLLEKNADYLATVRPTAVNLFWALERVKKLVAHKANATVAELKEAVRREAGRILDEDLEMGRNIGLHGYGLLKDCNVLHTHCNAGGLATGGYGTALAPMYVGLENGKTFEVFADETRPLLQGSRITAFELAQAGIPVTVICDNMAGAVMAQGKIDAAIVGADRIAANGDVANKIGTYGLARLARDHGVPFYVAAPSSTFDPEINSGKDIPIEERDSAEVRCGMGRQTAPDGVAVYNPAFDVTPNELVDGIITEKGVLTAPYVESIGKLLSA